MIKVKSFQIAENIDLKSFNLAYTDKPLFSSPHEIFYADGNDKFLYMQSYGVVVFAGYDDIKISELLIFAEKFCRDPIVEKFREEFIIHLGSEEDIFTYNEIYINQIDSQIMHIIMLNVGQSVALDYYSQIVIELLTKSSKLTRQLELKGKISISGKNLLKFIGETMNVKDNITENLYVLDSPDSTWENEHLAKIDTGLKKIFDIKLRFRELDEQLKIIRDNLILFIEIAHSRRSVVLEVIIVLLILIEVINLIVEKLF